MAAHRPALVVGVTGGIGSGKSEAARMFSELGAGVVDTDAVALELTKAGGAAMRDIAAAFGAQYVTADGALDRPRMRERVFSDALARNTLEAILHPLIRKQVALQIDTIKSPYALVLIPLLVETGGYPTLVERVLVVDVDEEVQIARTMARSGLTVDQVRAIMGTQATRAQRLAAADDIIDNNGSIEQLSDQVGRLHASYLEIALRRHG